MGQGVGMVGAKSRWYGWCKKPLLWLVQKAVVMAGAKSQW
jgi:hypothetical protein